MYQYPADFKEEVIQMLLAGKSALKIIRELEGKREELKKRGIERIPNRNAIGLWKKSMNLAGIKQKVGKKQQEKIIKKELTRREKEDIILNKYEFELASALKNKQIPLTLSQYIESCKYRRLRDNKPTDITNNKIEIVFTDVKKKDNEK